VNVAAGIGATVELEAHMSNVGIARRFVRSELEGRAPESAVSDLTLITSELVTNAFEHGSGRVVLTVRCQDGTASVTVTSGGQPAKLPTIETWATARADRVSGRGLGIVRQIGDDIEVDRSSDGVTITVHRKFRSSDD
jgi:anti-sigma regulatory factor (Ser/Thr protein kinase)